MTRNYIGDYIHVEKLIEYPFESQKLMEIISTDMPFKVQRYEGSYSIINRTGKTAFKILSTLRSEVSRIYSGVAVLFRYEYIKNIGLKEVNKTYKLLGIEGHVVAAGSGRNIEDFYYTRIENFEIYNMKKNEIINLIGELINIEKQ
jgi:hypothetical protein